MKKQNKRNTKRLPEHKKGVRIAGVIILWLLAAAVFLQLVLSIPLWAYKPDSGDNVQVRLLNKSIVSNSDLSEEELMELLGRDDVTILGDISERTSIAFLRRTYQGYYGIIRSCDGSYVYVFFNWALAVERYFSCTGFVSRQEALPTIQQITHIFGKGYDVSLPCYRLDTGAAYVVYCYTDGIDIVLYGQGTFLGNEGKEILYATKTESHSYGAIRINLLYRFVQNYRDVLYVKKADRLTRP